MNYQSAKTAFMVWCLFMLSVPLSCRKDDKKEGTPAPNAYAIGSGNMLYSFNLDAPLDVNSQVMTGIQAGESIVGIDIRPANKQLYALGSTGFIYLVNTTTGQAQALSAFATPLEGTAFGIDFIPTVDRLRIVSNADQNIRINPQTGALVSVDTDINPSAAAVSAIAYSNNFTGAASSVLYDIDPATDKLYKQESANQGILIPVGLLGIDVDENNGFDISGASNKAYALLTAGGATKLYSINLDTGAATPMGDFPALVKGFAVALNL